jgi:hypothetical protein
MHLAPLHGRVKPGSSPPESTSASHTSHSRRVAMSSRPKSAAYQQARPTRRRGRAPSRYCIQRLLSATCGGSSPTTSSWPTSMCTRIRPSEQQHLQVRRQAQSCSPLASSAAPPRPAASENGSGVVACGRRPSIFLFLESSFAVLLEERRTAKSV